MSCCRTSSIVRQAACRDLLAFVYIRGRRAIPRGSSIAHCKFEASATHKTKIMWTGPGMANERAAMERQKQKLRQGSSGPPARHARFGGLFVRRYNAEDRGCVVRSNPLVSHLPALPEPKKTNKTVVRSWSPDSCPALMLLSCICVFQCC